jgi:hypothetical protein
VSVGVLDDLAEAVEGCVVSGSGFGDVDAIWCNGKEIAHLADEATIDVRVGRKHIRERGLPARSRSSEWCEVPTADVSFVRELVELAASQHRSDDGTVRPPPTGPELERRRRFH